MSTNFLFRFLLRLKGGKDQNLPVLVSRVAPNSSAENAVPKLTEGDQVLQVNGTDVDGLPHEEVRQTASLQSYTL